jgi:hypothetical protein
MIEIGTPVYYRDQRMWVYGFSTTRTFAMIGNAEPRLWNPKHHECFHVPVGTIREATVIRTRNPLHKTKVLSPKAAETRAKKKAEKTPTVCAGLDDLYKEAAAKLRVKESELRAKYGHLSNGLQSMNLRNRIRGASK